MWLVSSLESSLGKIQCSQSFLWCSGPLCHSEPSNLAEPPAWGGISPFSQKILQAGSPPGFLSHVSGVRNGEMSLWTHLESESSKTPASCKIYVACSELSLNTSTWVATSRFKERLFNRTLWFRCVQGRSTTTDKSRNWQLLHQLKMINIKAAFFFLSLPGLVFFFFDLCLFPSKQVGKTS